jgi:hypothetical protein
MRIDKRVIVEDIKTFLKLENSVEIYSKEEVDKLVSNSSNVVLTVIDNLVANGTDANTTAILEYGVNVFTTVTSSNYCAKLPQPKTGKVTKVVNMSNSLLVIYPSNVGGRINNLAVDTPVVIPPDGISYEFICIENPLPGAWTWTPPATGQIELLEIAVNHTNGTDTIAYGVGNPGAQLINPVGANWYDNVSASQSGGVITLVPSADYWATSNLFPEKTLLKTKVYSNFVAANGVNLPSISRKVAYMPNTSGINVYSASGVNLSGGLTVGSGILNSPNEVGDFGTYYKLQDAIPVQVPPVETDKIGVGLFSNYYYTFVIAVPASAATKVYKFKIFLEYI